MPLARRRYLARLPGPLLDRADVKAEFLPVSKAELLSDRRFRGRRAAGRRFAAGVVVIADMTGTTFCDSMGFRMLVRACNSAGANGVELRLLVTCPHVVRVMKILGLDAELPLYRSLEDAPAGGG